MLVRMHDLPLAVFAADWTLLHSTSIWRTLFGAPSAMSDPAQNLIVQTFVDDSIAGIATAHGGPDAFERALVADLRRSASTLGGDPRFRSLINRVSQQSPRFAALWREGRAAAHRSLVKTVHNPHVGDITLDCDVVSVPDSDIKLVIYSTTESGPDADKLDFLRVTAIQATMPTDE
jgi:hypothetical protein